MFLFKKLLFISILIILFFLPTQKVFSNDTEEEYIQILELIEKKEYRKAVDLLNYFTDKNSEYYNRLKKELPKWEKILEGDIDYITKESRKSFCDEIYKDISEDNYGSAIEKYQQISNDFPCFKNVTRKVVEFNNLAKNNKYYKELRLKVKNWEDIVLNQYNKNEYEHIISYANSGNYSQAISYFYSKCTKVYIDMMFELL